MLEIYLATSALAEEGFEGKRTIEEARKANFDGVQLYLDPHYRDAEYREKVIEKLRESGLKLILHLPDTVEQADKEAAEAMVDAFPESRVLIHYIPTTSLPEISGTRVGWENSHIGPLESVQRKHLEEVINKVDEDGTFFVFDMGRLLYTPNEDVSPQETIDFIKNQLQELNPQKDVIHLADKKSWILKFRECTCVLGDGVMKHFLEDIKNFKGAIVFEHENLQMALDSLTIVHS